MDYYNILGLNKNASEEEIKNAYKKLARTHHPDKGGNTEKFQEIQSAYEILSDPHKKADFDNPQQPFGDFFHHHHGGFNFSNFFNRQQTVQKKPDIHHNYRITLNDVFNGARKKFNLTRSLFCKNCNKNCYQCNGTGKRTQTVQIGPMINHIQQPCYNCQQTGNVFSKNLNCNICKNGKIYETEIIEIIIPKAVINGHRYFFKDFGEQPTNSSQIPGDLFINITIDKHELFERDGINLRCSFDLTLKESMTNKTINIPYFNEEFQINTKDYGIINPYKEYVILKKGLSNEENNTGNLYIKFNIIYPDYKILNSEEINNLNIFFDHLQIL